MDAHQTAGASRVDGIDGLRALAALGVFYCHVSQYWLDRTFRLPGKLPEIVNNGAHGVDLFVVISGFCLAVPAARRGWSVERRSFYARRATRLLPPYAAALAVAAAIAMSGGYWRIVAERATATDLLAHVLLLQTWFPSVIGSVNGSFWSIALEAHLYLCFPAVLWCWRRWGGEATVAAAAALSVLWSTLHGLDAGAIGSEFVFPARLVQFVVGMGCADLVVHSRLPRRMLLWAMLCAGLGLGLMVSTADVVVGAVLVWTVPCASAVLLVAGSRHARFPGSWALTWFGTVSFSFYLVHQPVLLLTASAGRRLAPDPLAAFALGGTIGLAVTLAVSLPLHYLVERPSQRLGRRTRRPVVRALPA